MDPQFWQYLWLGLLVFFGLLEAATVGLTSVWFALGALVALVSASIGSPEWLQIVWFLLVSGLTLVGLRPMTQKYLKLKKISTNADRAIGQIGVVREKIDNIAGTGLVHVDGKLWTARSDTGAAIEKGAEVTILRIEGVKVIVTPVSEGKQRNDSAGKE